MSNHFTRSGSFTSFADWRFVHRPRLDVLSLNGVQWWGNGDKRCRLCGYNLESLPYVLSHYVVYSAMRQQRYNNIVNCLAKAIRLPGEMRLDSRVRGVHGAGADLRPDIVVTHERSKTVYIIDVTVPFGNISDAITSVSLDKVNKYQPTADL